MIYKPKYFKIEELVAPETLEQHGENRCWLMFDDRILRAADIIREDFGPMIVNNWATGGDRTQSGYREHWMQYYSPTSQHSFGRALDMLPQQAMLAEIQRKIRTNRDRYSFITGLEQGEGITWLHIDCRNNSNLQMFGK